MTFPEKNEMFKSLRFKRDVLTKKTEKLKRLQNSFPLVADQNTEKTGRGLGRCAKYLLRINFYLEKQLQD